MPKFNKKKLPSRHTSVGPDKAPQRSFYYAMDLTEKDVAKPFVGVVSTWNEAAASFHVETTPTKGCLLYTSPSPRDRSLSRMPSSA